MNFESGTPLARFQDDLLTRIKNHENIIFDKNIISRLEDNMWVKSAEKLAPNNLVIRQYCLIDILTTQPRNAQKIELLIQKLAPQGYCGRLWAEGYSYWEYTKQAIDLWIENVKHLHGLNCYLIDIDRGFQETSYEREGIRYPAPFGDVRDEPLRPELQYRNTQQVFIWSGRFLKKSYDRYWISPYLLGGNTHTPSKESSVVIKDGRPVNFKFYTGYDNKFTSRKSEAINIGTRIIKSIFK